MDIATVQSLILLATCLVGSFDVLLLASCILCIMNERVYCFVGTNLCVLIM